mmetsp:Transcript_31880/g.100062  ORF Transcript_31880/g.100062 Transcript_31880/m.100062 type:complete len:270 (-) Transcript_31880:413-1222(-)
MPKRRGLGRAPRPLDVGDAVRASFKKDKLPPRFTAEWPGKGCKFPGMVAGVHPDGCIDVYFNDGFFETRVLPQHVTKVRDRVHRQWRTTGHELIGQRVRREFHNGKGMVQHTGQVVCWCPAGEVAREDLSWDETFHVIHSDDDEEALSLDVVRAALDRGSARPPQQPAPPAAQPPAMATASDDADNCWSKVREMLQKFKLSEYECAFEEQGYDDYEYLMTIDAGCLKDLIDDVGMKPGHGQKLRHYLHAEQSDYWSERGSKPAPLSSCV